ncbi:MAG: YkgJ family cysteine cluster protein [Pseudomonadota bacterium]
MSDGPFELPHQSDVIPEILEPETEIQFRCHKGVSCFNACCRRADITMTPYDIIRLKQRFGMASGEFLKEYTVPFEMDADKVPGIKMRTDEDGACVFMTDEGCSVYEDRPTSCRYYPLGHLAMRAKDSAEDEAHFVLVKEEHCKGHEEDRKLRIKDYLVEQDIPMYREMNREWLQLLLKKKSAGPGVGHLSETSLQLYFMACFDSDRFRRFVLSDGFKKSYDLDASMLQTLKQDDVALMRFAFRFLRQVLFGERTLGEKEGIWDERVEQRSEVWDARREAEIARRKKADDDKYKDGVT